MTIKFIFDLDLTLYSDNEYTQTDDEDIYYNSFKRKPFLKELLQSIPHPKYILTNASKDHAEDVLKKMGITKCFKNMMSADMFELYKPSIQTYKVAINLFKIRDTDKVFYFEDLAENLKPAKENYNWTTIWLTKNAHNNKRKPKYVDYKFSSVEEAMMYLCAQFPELAEEVKIENIDNKNVATDNKSS
jgi:FMN phosphatase YigB (HAD superfamily)